MPLKSFNNEFPLLVQALLQAKNGNRLGHAYIVYSNSPVIRESFAKALAQLVLCTSPSDDGDACGNCHTCSQVERDVYPEIYRLEPRMKSRVIKTGDGPDDPDTMRWFEHQFYLSSVADAGIKIGIILDADCMQENGQNLFLKTLEEPPGRAMFILETANPSSLLTTIRSRCQTLMLLTNRCDYDFPGAAELFKVLNQIQFHSNDLVASEKNTEELLKLAGSLKKISEKQVQQEWKKRLGDSKQLEGAARKRLDENYTAAQQAKYLDYRRYFISAIHAWFAKIYQLSCVPDAAQLSASELFKYLDVAPNQLDERKCYKALKHTDDLLYNLRFNVNEELAFRTFCLNVSLDSNN